MNFECSQKIINYWIQNNTYYSMKDKNKFADYFFSWVENKKLLNFSNTKLFDIQETEIVINKPINIILCVENCYFWKHYLHYNKFGNYGDSKINIYLYNHINKFVETEKYIAIPVIYLQIDYYLKFKNSIGINTPIPFNKKKFCLIISKPKGKFVKELTNIENRVKSLFPCDHISKYFNIIGNESCYHSEKLLRILNQYKFVLCYENSFTDGYITEKIFNVFFAKSIPIYGGPNDVRRYFNNKCFFNIREINSNKQVSQSIVNISQNEKLFQEIINCEKINKEFNNENYIVRSNNFIKKIIS